MKRGGELIYAGPLGPRSCELIKYFEVRLHIFIPLTYMIYGLFVLYIKYELSCIHSYAIHNCFVGS